MLDCVVGRIVSRGCSKEQADSRGFISAVSFMKAFDLKASILECGVKCSQELLYLAFIVCPEAACHLFHQLRAIVLCIPTPDCNGPSCPACCEG